MDAGTKAMARAGGVELETDIQQAARRLSCLREKMRNYKDIFECPICYELYVEATTLNCGHTFCEYCVKNWKLSSMSCPICREAIKTENPCRIVDKAVENLLMDLPEERMRKALVEQRKAMVMDLQAAENERKRLEFERIASRITRSAANDTPFARELATMALLISLPADTSNDTNNSANDDDAYSSFLYAIESAALNFTRDRNHSTADDVADVSTEQPSLLSQAEAAPAIITNLNNNATEQPTTVPYLRIQPSLLARAEAGIAATVRRMNSRGRGQQTMHPRDTNYYYRRPGPINATAVRPRIQRADLQVRTRPVQAVAPAPLPTQLSYRH